MNLPRRSTPCATTLALLSLAALLSACTTVKNGPSRSDVLPPLPRLEDPQAATMLQRLEPEYRRWLANPSGYVITPAQPTAWPCEVPPRELEEMAGVPKANDAQTLAAYAKAEREAGYKRGTLKPGETQASRVFLLKGSCVAGKLEGDVELLAEYTRVEPVMGGEQTTEHRVLTRFNASGGAARGLRFRATLNGKFRSSKPDKHSLESTYAAASFSLAEASTVPGSRSVNISYSRHESPGAFTGTYLSLMQFTSVSLPVRGNRWKTISYVGSNKGGETNYKGKQKHGKEIGYAFPMNTTVGILMTDASETCFDEGEKIKSAACDVD